MSISETPSYYMHHAGRDYLVEGCKAAKLERLLSKHAPAVAAPAATTPASAPNAPHAHVESAASGSGPTRDGSAAAHAAASAAPGSGLVQAGLVKPLAGKRSAFDPPAAGAKAGAVATFPGKGRAVYWPRMPCLRCGCPWWSGEEWDATCVRCSWGCEADGYDDDSRPLATGPWQARYNDFTALLKQGRAAQWPP